MSDRPFDMSKLAADADPAHWDAFMRRTLDRVDGIMAERVPAIGVFDQLALWSRPALVLAAAVILLLLPILVRNEIKVTPGPNGMATISRIWATGGPAPTGAVLGGVVERKQP
jgi:hypothetical protein